MAEPIFTEQKIMDKVSKCSDLSKVQDLIPTIKKEAVRTMNLSLAIPLQAAGRLFPWNQNYNPIDMKFEYDPNSGKKEEMMNKLQKGNLYLMASPFLTERIASIIINHGKESSNSLAQKEKIDKQIYKNMDKYVDNLRLTVYSMLSPMFLKAIREKMVNRWLDEQIAAIKKDIEVAEKEGKKIEAKKAKNELEFFVRLTNPEGLPYECMQIGAKIMMDPPNHVVVKLKDMPKPGELRLAIKILEEGSIPMFYLLAKDIRSNEKNIVKNLTEAMEKFRQA